MTYNVDAVEAATTVTAQAVDKVLSMAGAHGAVVLRAPAGAGKSTLVVTAAGRARNVGLRVTVCAPTNDQAFGLVEALAARYPGEQVTFVPARGVTLPAHVAVRTNVVQARPAAQANGARLIVGTFDKLGDAFTRGDLPPVDVLLADESFQADAGRYFAIAGLAPTHLLVGDPGQLDPFTTIDDADRWRGLAEDPLQDAVSILVRNHPDTAVYQLPLTRRLDSRAVPVVRAFYPGHPFEAAILPGVRQLRLLRGVATDVHTRLLDATLNLAAEAGWAHLELPAAPILTADPDTITLVVDLLRRLAERAPETRCERLEAWTPLQPRRIAVGVSHNDQKDLLRIALDRADFCDVVVETANKLQGAEFDLVIAWHPLAGLPDPDRFHLEPGRACVLLTRHRHACIVIGRSGDRALLDELPPSPPAYLGWEREPLLDGWEVHEAVLEKLEAFRLAV